MRPDDSCLDSDRLLALHRGELSAEEQQTARSHLAVCPDCVSRLGAIESAEAVPVSTRSASAEAQPQHRTNGGQSGALTTPPSQLPPVGEPTIDEGLHLPARLGKYELTEVLGRGGMGVVYRARHTRLDREFAVKVIRPEYADHPRVVARFLREALALGGLAHPNVVAATDADEIDGCHFLVMELIDGLDLETLVKLSGPLPIPAACEAVRQAATGLQAVHEKGRIHRDLKPSNLMLESHGVVKILDLGLAGLLPTEDASSEKLTGSRFVLGTPDYVAPEQWVDCSRVDVRADVYSLGCTLYKLLVGSAPFSGPEYARAARKELAHAEAPRPSARAARSEVPPALDAVVRRMMAIDPAERHPVPKEVADGCPPVDRS